MSTTAPSTRLASPARAPRSGTTLRERDGWLANPRLPLSLRLITTAEILALAAAGIGLFLFPGAARPVWAWDVTPFNAAFLGAIYLSSLAAVGTMQLEARWIPARVVLALIFTFTAIVLVVTLAYLPRFVLDRWATWAWLVLYLVLPISSAHHWWRLRSRSSAPLRLLSRGWRAYLTAQGAVMTVYTVALLMVPALATAFWPWKVDDFHARMYSGMFSATALAALMLAASAARSELRMLGLSQAIFAGGGLLGTVLVDRTLRRLDWSSTATWSWVGLSALLATAGLAMVWSARRPLAVAAQTSAVDSRQ